MGAYCPVSIAGDALLERVRREVLEPTLRELAARSAPYTGVLYAGLMLAADGTPYVLEFNCRFGDPETQALLPLLPGVTRHLAGIAAGSWHPTESALAPARAAVATVLAAPGYPDKPRSEEHTSELQSLAYLVCRLLLEKKKNQKLVSTCDNRTEVIT